MFKKALLLFLFCACFALAGTPTKTFHTDHRANFVELEYVQSNGAQTDLNPEDVAFQFLADHAGSYGLADTDNLELAKVQESLLGTHFHYQQKLFGHDVYRAEIIVSVSNQTGDVFMVFNNSYPTHTVKHASPAHLSADDAFDVAWQDLRVHDDMIAAPKADLVYIPEGQNFRLVYQVDLAVEAPFGYWRHTIDAGTGDILEVKSTAISRKPQDAMDFAAWDGPVIDRQLAFRDYALKQRAQEESLSRGKAAANGSAQVFDPDPVTVLQNSSLTDGSAASAFTAAYSNRTLQGIDLTSGVYRLNGPWVNILNFETPNTAPSTTTNGSWTATRGNNAFNDAMTYFHVDQSQRYMQSLGFTGSTGIQYGSIAADSDGLSGDDNSHFIPSSNRIAFGHGCVDDNEDAFVILHEYGHAIHHSINSNWSGGDTGGMGEGFGDYWAASYRNRTSNGATFNPAWAFPWDGHNSCWGGRTLDKTSYQYDPTKSYPAHATVGSVYSDELWSTPLFQALLTLKSQGVAQSEVDRIILQAHFGLGSGLTMRTMATAIVNTAQSLYPSGPHKSVLEAKFVAQNILTGGTTPPPTGTALSNGVPVTGLSGASGSDTLYYIDVPSGASNLTIATSGGSGDCDLYTKFGSAPTTSSYDCRPYASGNNESCPVASPQVGRYYVLLHGYSSFSGMTLTASFTTGGGGGCTPGSNNQSNLSGASGSWKYFTIVVPSCATQLNVAMSGGTGDADLYTRFGAQPTTSTYTCRPYKSGNSETCTQANPSAGTWHIGVRGYSAYSGVNLTIAYQ